MDNNDVPLETFGAALILLTLSVLVLKRRRRGGIRRWWRHPTLIEEDGEYAKLFLPYKNTSHDRFFRYTRMEVWQFDELLKLVGPRLRRFSMRKPVPPEERLAITIRYLAHGGNLITLAEAYRRGHSTVNDIVRETCDAIWEALSPIYVKTPSREDWPRISREFWELWNFPNCLGAVDGKHVEIICPPNAGSVTFNNHYSSHSTVLMAMCDAKYRFTYVDLGSYGSQSDSSIFMNSQFGRDLLEGNLDLPPEQPMPFTREPHFPHWMVADQAFPLSENILRPYPGKSLTEEQRVFNYRLSRARRCIENAFGILVGRWRLFRKRIQALPETVDSYLKAAICLHNFVITTQEEGTSQYCPPNYVDREDGQGRRIDGAWRADPQDDAPLFRPIGRIGANRAGVQIIRMRDQVAQYLVSEEGAVDWQDRIVWEGYE
ncbi:protein ALP1-like [Thrips palmi]|uniref:Protein ALP1-like n=1 Tax=Thrips palmi TaxID=161013 RepID=A0A6P8ZBS5_THRPL|nr:protein ALP1-like [Thrips palmi]